VRNLGNQPSLKFESCINKLIVVFLTKIVSKLTIDKCNREIFYEMNEKHVRFYTNGPIEEKICRAIEKSDAM